MKSLLTLFLLASLTSCASTDTFQLIANPTPISKDTAANISADQFESGLFTSSRGTQLAYRVLCPSKPIAGQQYPLVVQLHGSGEIGTNNLAQLDRLAKSWAMPDIRARYPAYVLIPQFPIRSANYGPASPTQHAVASAALEDARELIADFRSKHAVDASRIYATGFSMGGSATWLLPKLSPNTFAAIVPIAGIAPPDSDATSYFDLPILAMHGNADNENPITADKRFITTITQLGGQKATLREYQGLIHLPPADVYPGYWWRDWLFKQRRK
ncbi:dienelactone hydrolase family protein [Undibacterium fentianense]|uniref:Dienelactone hydrolase family protein n=1 Tax=Undibacterium fentianense TaxID=2828728 RepID=A0A941IE77_9BURK|nr:PHB depolymerase family esterase [Undibacterium fentianense]MBR7800793.1 dienelactone hydrolase family protein [Undibacterium fentianense]